jgi:hypothetical protein
MKKKITVSMLILLLIATLAYAGIVRTSGVIAVTSAAAASITAAEGFLLKVIIKADRESTCTFNLYDFATNSGYTTTEFELFPTVSITTTETGEFDRDYNFPRLQFRDGLYYTITSTGEIAVYYEQ